MSTVLTCSERRDAIVAYVTGKGWLPVAELVAYLRDDLGLAPKAGACDLRLLVEQGRIERRATGAKGHVLAFKAYEYRATSASCSTLPERPAPAPRARQPHPAEVQRQRIRSHVSRYPDRQWTTFDLAKVAGCSRLTVNKRIDDLIGEGVLEDAAEGGHRLLRRCA